MDTPTAPINPKEQHILDALIRIRDSLLLLRKDKSSYIKTIDVIHYYEAVVIQVEKLNATREEQVKRLAHNRGLYSIESRYYSGSLTWFIISGLCIGRLLPVGFVVISYRGEKQ